MGACRQVRGLLFANHNFEFGAVARTLTSILEEAAAPNNIDLLSLDVEGNEQSVLRGLDLNKYHFDTIVIETHQFDAINSLLSEFGYKYVATLSSHESVFRGPRR